MAHCASIPALAVVWHPDTSAEGRLEQHDKRPLQPLPPAEPEPEGLLLHATASIRAEPSPMATAAFLDFMLCSPWVKVGFAEAPWRSPPAAREGAPRPAARW